MEVSANGGETWAEAKLKSDEIVPDDSTRSYGWVRWELAVAAAGGARTLCCRATDDQGTVQPPVGELNGGYVYNGYNEVQLRA